MSIANQSNPPSETTSHSFWRKHFDSYQKTKLSKSAYCRQNELILHQFLYWYKKFEEQTQTVDVNDFVKVQIKSESSLTENKLLCTLEWDKTKRLLVHDIKVLNLLLNILREEV